MRKLVLMIICLSLLKINVNAATSYYYDNQWHEYNEQPVALQIDGSIVKTEVPPLILNGRTLVPVRSVFEKMGASVSWDNINKKVKVIYDNTSVELTIDSDTALINGTEFKMDMPAKIINDSRTMIPLRFVAEKLGMKVDWNEKTKLICISKPDKAAPVAVVADSKNPNIPGIDVSNWQGDINFQDVKASGVKVVYIKATEGVTYTDPYLQKNYQGASKSGLKVGFYHFLRANDPVEEAKNFLNQVGSYHTDCKYMIDVESAYDQTPEQISSNVRKFADYLISQGKEVGIYTYLNFYKNYLNDTVKDLPVWIAQYDVIAPAVDCIGWQSSSKGSVMGIDTNVDVDYFGNAVFAGGTGNLKGLTTVKGSGTKTVKVSSCLNVRSSPSTAGDIIGQLSNGEKVNYNSYVITPNNETWYIINFNGQEGFINGDYLV